MPLLTVVTIGQSLSYTVFGMAVVFVALIFLMAICGVTSLFFKNKKDTAKAVSAPAVQAAPAAPAAPAAAPGMVPGAKGEVKLFDVPDKTAAMIMAIVADKNEIPLEQLKFISIKQID